MADYLKRAADMLREVLLDGLGRLVASGVVPCEPISDFTIAPPSDPAHGDFFTNIAMCCAKPFAMPPRKIATLLREELVLDGTDFARVALADSGFLNFFLRQQWYADVIQGITAAGNAYGTTNTGSGKSILISYASQAEPLAIDNVRMQAIGACLAQTLTATGYLVTFSAIPPPQEPDQEIVITNAAFGEPPDGFNDRVRQLPVQPVSFQRDGKAAMRAKRSGSPLTAATLSEELSADALYFLCNLRPPGTALPLDLDFAVEQAPSNPFYQVQSAYALLSERCMQVTVPELAALHRLDKPQENALIRQLAALPAEWEAAARQYDPSRIVRYTITLAGKVHALCAEYSVKTAESPELQAARAQLFSAAKQTFSNALTILPDWC